MKALIWSCLKWKHSRRISETRICWDIIGAEPTKKEEDIAHLETEDRSGYHDHRGIVKGGHQWW